MASSSRLADDLDDGPVGFESFYVKEYPPMLRRAYLLLGSRAAAEDVVQDSFLQVFHRWSAIAEPGPYLSRVVLNACRDVQARQGRLSRIMERLRPPEVEAPPSGELTDALQALPFNQRAVVILKYFADQSHEEIAAHLGCSPGSVGPWLDRAHKSLRKVLPDGS